MPRTRTQQAHDYAERIRARLGRRLRALLQSKPISPYGFAQECGISRQMIGKILNGKSIPSLVVIAQLSFGAGLTLTEFVSELEDGAEG